MTRIYLHIGLEAAGTARLQQVMADKREQMLAKGVLFPRAAGPRNHTRLYMAVTDPDHVDALRLARGYADPVKQAGLRAELSADLARDIATHQPRTVILAAYQLGTALSRPSELERLRAMLAPLCTDIRIIAHVDAPSQMLARHYAAQVMIGRTSSLDLERGLNGQDWWDGSRALAAAQDPAKGRFALTQSPPFWLDYAKLVTQWEGVFGAGTVTLRPYDMERFFGEAATEEIRASFDIADTLGRAEAAPIPEQPSAAWITRARQLNDLLFRLADITGQPVPRQLWQNLIKEIKIDGEAIVADDLSVITKPLNTALKKLLPFQPALGSDIARQSRRKPASVAEADPGMGFRASQYLLAFRARITRAVKEEQARTAPESTLDEAAPLDGRNQGAAMLGTVAAQVLPARAIENFHKLQTSPFHPHNRLGMVNEEELAAAYTSHTGRRLPAGNSGRVIVGCMKNEAPYIAEWVAYHRAIGVDNFLIYTNDCTDGTAEILDRMQALGLVQHRNNDGWKGNSPQQSALNKALREPLIRNAEWIIHIDVDEFINIRCDNGTLDDFFARVPNASNVAMTWRLFGHGGVTDLSDGFVIDQFEYCAPRFCPKPHTAWGFKTMFRNTGAYAKMSCHRPNKLNEALRDQVRWVNGSGQDMTREVAENGWRNSIKSIGYDLLQLNHYALRSAESFLIKRQRGRALHVDRAIGINYWIRMDWGDARDITIKRNMPRLRAEFDRMMQDDKLRGLHEQGLDWHRAKAAELHDMPEFRELYDQALTLKLTAAERVAYALALDMES